MSNTTLTPPSHATHVRWHPILSLVFAATLINYLDRAVFSIARPLFVAELGMSPLMAGLLGSAFAWSYALAQIPGGAVLDRFGTRLTYCVSLIGWSLATMAMGLARGVGSMMGLRIVLGVFEAPCFPANSRVLNSWFPRHERARANSIYAIGMYAGLAFLSVPLFWIAQQFTWRGLFIISGLVGVLFGIIWYVGYREPADSQRVNQAELDYIAAGGGTATEQIQQTPFTLANMMHIVRLRPLLIASLAQFAGNTVLNFFLLDFVNYLATQRQMPWLKAGIFLSFPYLAAAVGGVIGGQVSDRILRRGGSANLARKLPVAGGLVLASTVVLANFVPVGEDALVIAIMSLAFFGQGMTNLGWTTIADMAPLHLIGLTGGFFNMITNLAGILTPLILGIVLQLTGSYYYSLFYVGALPLIGALLYVFALGDVRRLEMPKAS